MQNPYKKCLPLKIYSIIILLFNVLFMITYLNFPLVSFKTKITFLRTLNLKI